MQPYDTSSPPFLLPGVYVFLAAPGVNGARAVLYVGESGNIPQRIEQHRRTKKWFPQVDEIRTWTAGRPEDRLAAEAVLILRHRPRHNRTIKIGLRADGSLYALSFLQTRGG